MSPEQNPAVGGPAGDTVGDVASYFDELVTWATGHLSGEEVLTATLGGENSDFVRFNAGRVRQAGSVRQRELGLDLIEGNRHTSSTLELTQDTEIDRARVLRTLESLREQRAMVPEDPYLVYSTSDVRTSTVRRADLPEPATVLGEVGEAASGPADLVGIYAAGDSFDGFASSLGQRNWAQSATFSLDWSMHLRADKAAKNTYAGFDWDHDAFETKVEWSRRQLRALDREPISLSPGGYRVFLEPAALRDILEIMAWGGFGLKSHRTRQTPLLQMVTEGTRLHPTVTISENTAAGMAPDFQEQGFSRPDEVVLISEGEYTGWLISPRSGREYGVENNGAASHEAPSSIDMAPGPLPREGILEELGTGLYIGNLWYLNFSDRSACRTTGMTRFGTFWVDQGEIVAPVNVLRFDDTAYNLLGQQLVGLTDEAEFMADPSSYFRRSSDSARVPGALVAEMRFAL